MPKSPYMGVTNTVDYKCHNRGVITELILHKHTCINRKIGVLDPPPLPRNAGGHPREIRSFYMPVVELLIELIKKKLTSKITSTKN